MSSLLCICFPLPMHPRREGRRGEIAFREAQILTTANYMPSGQVCVTGRANNVLYHFSDLSDFS